MAAGRVDRYRASRGQLDRGAIRRRAADQLLHHRHSGCRSRFSQPGRLDRVHTGFPESYGRNQYVLTNSGEQAATVFGLKMWAEGSIDKLAVLFAATASAANGSAASRGYGPLENDQDVVGELLTDPNAASFARGRLFSDRAFTIKWTTTYRFPKDIQLGVIARYQDGQPFARLVAVPGLNQGTELIRAYPNAGNGFTFTAHSTSGFKKRSPSESSALPGLWTFTIWQHARMKWRNTRSPVRTSGRPRRLSRRGQSTSVSASCCRPVVFMLLWGTLVAAAVALGWAFARLWRIAAIGSAYRSKVLCSIVFASGRLVDPQRVEDVSGRQLSTVAAVSLARRPLARTVTTSFAGCCVHELRCPAGLGATLFLALPESRADLQVRPSTASLRAPSDSHGEPERLAQASCSASSMQHSQANPTRHRRTRAIVVVRDGEIMAERYAPGFDANTRLAGWSMAKSVLNALVGILGEQRFAAASCAPADSEPPDPRAAITIEDLLRMRSGLSFSEAYADFSSDVIEMLFNQPDAAAVRRPPAAPFHAGHELELCERQATSSRPSYNARSATRRISGGRGARCSNRLAMTSTILEPDASGTFVCSSFMLANARDWARFGQLFLQDGVWNGHRILPEEVGFVQHDADSPVAEPQFRRALVVETRGRNRWRYIAAARIATDAFYAMHEAKR